MTFLNFLLQEHQRQAQRLHRRQPHLCHAQFTPHLYQGTLTPHLVRRDLKDPRLFWISKPQKSSHNTHIKVSWKIPQFVVLISHQNRRMRELFFICHKPPVRLGQQTWHFVHVFADLTPAWIGIGIGVPVLIIICVTVAAVIIVRYVKRSVSSNIKKVQPDQLQFQCTANRYKVQFCFAGNIGIWLPAYRERDRRERRMKVTRLSTCTTTPPWTL